MAAPYQPAFPPDHYLNRELSWLEFNARVLEEAADKTNPLLERLKFAAIFAGIEPQDYGADGLDPAEQLSLIATRVHALVAEQHRLLDTEIMPGLAAAGIQRVALDSLDAAERDYLDKLFAREIYPVLTPLAIDPGHPFPHVHNKSLNIVLLVENAESGQQLYGVVQVPALLDRVVALPGGDPDKLRFVLLEEIIAAHLGDLFGGFKVLAHTVFRVTRNTDLAINEDDDLVYFRKLSSNPVMKHPGCDPYGWLERNSARLSTVKTADDTAAVMFDNEPAIPVVGLPMKLENGKWYVVLPIRTPPLSNVMPRSRQQWSILGSVIKVTDNVPKVVGEIKASSPAKIR